MMHPDDPKLILLGLAKYISVTGAIPIEWLKTYSQYQPLDNRILVRIDCMEVTFSSGFYSGINNAKEAKKLLPEIDRFVMLLWGEPCCPSN